MKCQNISKAFRRIKVVPGVLFTVKTPLIYKKQLIERGHIYVVLGVRQENDGTFIVDACKRNALKNDLTIRSNALIYSILMSSIVSLIGYIKLDLPPSSQGIAKYWIHNHKDIPKLSGYFTNIFQQKYL
jgi:hypothetical protein